MEVISVNCILFTSLELLLGNTEGAMTHVRCGTQMLRNWQEERLKSTSVAPYSELMDRYVIPIFSHMNFHASIMYGTPALLHIEQLEVRKSRKFSRFRDVVEARAILLDIENEGIEVANTRVHCWTFHKTPKSLSCRNRVSLPGVESGRRRFKLSSWSLQ
jgi:hypothetical protein